MKEVKSTHIGSYGVIKENEKILLIKKARGGYKGKLDLPGGGIEFFETPEEALIREIKEETGLDVINFKILDAISKNFKWQMTEKIIEDLHHLGILYHVKAKGKIKSEPDGLDSLGAKWYKINSLKKEELTPFAFYALGKLGYKGLEENGRISRD